MARSIHELARCFLMDSILRIGIGMEGDWSITTVTVWTRKNEFLDFDKVVHSHSTNQA